MDKKTHTLFHCVDFKKTEILIEVFRDLILHKYHKSNLIHPPTTPNKKQQQRIG